MGLNDNENLSEIPYLHDKPDRPIKGEIASGVRTISVDEEDDDYLNRGFRDFLFPWKG